MKHLSLLILFFSFTVNAQITTSLVIEGAIAKPLSYSQEDFKAFKLNTLDSLVILNHKMERKSILKDIKGVLLKDLLENAEFTVNSPKVLSEFYIVCEASDGFKVVFSWNEIFNGVTGDKALVVTSMNGKSSKDLSEGLLLIVPTDKVTGRRYVRNLSKILIQKVN